MKYKLSGIFLLLAFWSVAARREQSKPVDSKQFTFLTSDHVKIPVNVSGKGYPCMFVPGGPGGGYRSFEQLGGNKLESFLTMIYMDQRGSGSAQNAKDYSMDRILQDMDELRAKLHIEKMFLLSHSFGGVILINYAKKYPQHVKGIILVNSTLHFLNTESLLEQIKYGYGLLGKDTVISDHSLQSLSSVQVTLRQRLSKKHLAYKLLTDSVNTIKALDKIDSIYPRINDFAYKILGPVIDKNASMLYPEYFKNYTTLTAAIRVPVLIITGTKDHAIGINHYHLFKFPHQTIVKINGGHLLYAEQNEAFVKAVNQFIDFTKQKNTQKHPKKY
jgi:proline iminopeptidase